MNLEPSAGGSPDTARVKEFDKCAGCALVKTCASGPNGNTRQLVVLTVAGDSAEKCGNFVPEDAALPGEQPPDAEGNDHALQ